MVEEFLGRERKVALISGFVCCTVIGVIWALLNEVGVDRSWFQLVVNILGFLMCLLAVYRASARYRMAGGKGPVVWLVNGLSLLFGITVVRSIIGGLFDNSITITW